MTDEEFGMGYLELKLAAASASKSSAVNSVAISNGSGPSVSQGELGRTVVAGRVADGKLDRPDSSMPKPDLGQVKQKGSHSIDGLDVQSMPSAALLSDTPSQKHVDDTVCTEESTIKTASKIPGEQEVCSLQY